MEATKMVGHNYGIELLSGKRILAKDFDSCKSQMLLTSKYGWDDSVTEAYEVVYPPYKTTILEEGSVVSLAVTRIECGDVKSLFEFYKEGGRISWLNNFDVFKEFKRDINFLSEIEINKHEKQVARYEYKSLYSRLDYKEYEDRMKKRYSYEEFFKIIFEEFDKRVSYLAQIQEIIETGKLEFNDGKINVNFGSDWVYIRKDSAYAEVSYYDLSIAELEDFIMKASTI